MMEVTQSPKMSVPIYQSARRPFPEKCKLHNDGCECSIFHKCALIMLIYFVGETIILHLVRGKEKRIIWLR